MSYRDRGYRVAKTQYKGASRKMGRWGMKKMSPDVVIRDLPTLRGRSDYLYKNNSLARSAVNKNLDIIFGSGLRPHPVLDHKALGISKKKAKKIARAMLREFDFWAKSVNCDAERSQYFYELQISVFYMMLIGGDSFSLLPSISRPNTPYTTAIANISADQVCNPDGRMDREDFAGGIEVDGDNAPIFYYILKKHPNGIGYKQKEWQKVRAFDDDGRPLVLHLFQKLEAGQKRGVPYLSPIISLVKTLGDYSDAEVTASLVSALFTVFVKSESGEGLSFDIDDENKKSHSVDYAMSAGSVINLKDGESIEIADPNRPNKNYDVFHRAIIKEFAVGLNLSYEVIMTEFNNSFTSSRAVLLQVWKYFKKMRTLINNRWNQPTYERVIEEAVLLDRLDLPNFLEDPFMRSLWLKTAWVGELAGAIDEIKEAKAAKMRVEAGFSTRKRESSMMNGTSFDDNMNVADDESRKMIRANLMEEKAKNE